MMGRVANLSTGLRSLIATILAMLALSAVAVAYFASSGTGTAHAGVGSVNSPSNVAAHQSAADVAISWNAASLPSGANVDGYRVTRSDGTAVCGSPSLVSGLSCVDSNVHAGTYT